MIDAAVLHDRDLISRPRRSMAERSTRQLGLGIKLATARTSSSPPGASTMRRNSHGRCRVKPRSAPTDALPHRLLVGRPDEGDSTSGRGFVSVDKAGDSVGHIKFRYGVGSPLRAVRHPRPTHLAAGGGGIGLPAFSSVATRFTTPVPERRRCWASAAVYSAGASSYRSPYIPAFRATRI